MRRRFINNINGDVIYYTSTDAHIISPNDGSLRTSIVSNTYDKTGGKIVCKGKIIIIGENAFRGTITLETITIPRNVVEIAEAAFYNCAMLSNVTIPESVTSIGREAFYECYGLKSVTIPDSVTTILDSAFNYCKFLKSVYCKATTPPALGYSNVFDNNGSGRKIYVPAGSVEAYKSTTYWSRYASDIVGYNF